MTKAELILEIREKLRNVARYSSRQNQIHLIPYITGERLLVLINESLVGHPVTDKPDLLPFLSDLDKHCVDVLPKETLANLSYLRKVISLTESFSVEEKKELSGLTNLELLEMTGPHMHQGEASTHARVFAKSMVHNYVNNLKFLNGKGGEDFVWQTPL